MNEVDKYWGYHLVSVRQFNMIEDSEEHNQWRVKLYPMFPQLMEMPGEHSGETILDYGCGTGNDITWWLSQNNVNKVIGIDISDAALTIARERIDLYETSVEVELIKVEDSDTGIPLPDDSVDYVHSAGCLHHASKPQTILHEFKRILKTNGRGKIMVYNSASVWFHLIVAYKLMILDNEKGDIHEVFARSTDGADCPISRNYYPDDFVEMCSKAGLKAQFMGGYETPHELNIMKGYYRQAIADEWLGKSHKDFLESLTGHPPKYHGKYAGVGGVYSIKRRTDK